ncbi:vomeronasal type-1 receptor 4-like [Sturnira hondurensis]|uniref:vomeronasal type-1 receptor 4-like n=1 Tax=Sturnira hondurensis TaxID=192404 RepID=UPI0018798481|nr:vomeronasal type-1 receptor 4-like [Sturnira hondurensis]
MSIRNLAIGMVFLLHTITGVVGNSSLLYHYLFLYFTGYRLKPTDFIVNNLIVANFSVLFFSGFPNSMSSFGWYTVYSDIGCKLFHYFRAVGRGVSIGTTCLLSLFQAITISPTNSRWANLKHKAPKYIVPTIFLYWILQMLINVVYPLFLSSKLSNRNITNKKHLGHCSSVRHEDTRDLVYAALIASPDVVCFLLMLWASGSMLFILYRHKHRVQSIHRTCISSLSSPESRAIKTILLLVSTFLFCNALSSIFHIFLAILKNPNWFIVNTSSLISLSFPTVSPFLILGRNSNVSRFSFTWERNAKFCHFRRNM